MSINREATIRWKGYDPDNLSPKSHKKVWANCDRCGKGRWLHKQAYRALCQSCWQKGRKQSPETIAKRVAKMKGHVTSPATRALIAKKQIGRPLSESHRAAVIDARRREKSPLPNGWESCTLTTNKDCADYLGGVAEMVLSRTFHDVQMMPHGNIGYDFVCNHGKKIDVKSSTTRPEVRWSFSINKNAMADFFLCIAFDNRRDLNPLYVWLIPGDVLNHLTGTYISESTLSKWDEYKLDITKVISCCDTIRGTTQ